MAIVVFSSPVYLWFLLAVPLLIFFHYVSLGFTKRKALKFANFEAIARVTGGEVYSRNTGLLVFRVIIFLLVILGISGASLYYTGKGTNFDFVLVIDSSLSMLADDLTPTRLDVAKIEAKNFVDTLPPEARVGIISFSSSAVVEQELSEDRIQTIANLDAITSRSGGSDLGESIITGTNLLLKTDRSRVIVLMTDGQVNVGTPLPEAVDYANKNLVTIYTLGIGTVEGGKFPGLTENATSTLGENILESIALSSGGEYYKVENRATLKGAYEKIGSFTKKKTSTRLTGPFLLVALILLILEWILLNTKYRAIP